MKWMFSHWLCYRTSASRIDLYLNPLYSAYTNEYNQRTTKPTIILVWPTKTLIRLRGCACWSDSSLIACAFYSLQAIRRWINENPCRARWMYRLVWVFSGYTELIVDFVVRWLHILDTRHLTIIAFRQFIWLHYNLFITQFVITRVWI